MFGKSKKSKDLEYDRDLYGDSNGKEDALELIDLSEDEGNDSDNDEDSTDELEHYLDLDNFPDLEITEE